MKSSVFSPWRPGSLLWMGLFLHCAEASVLTEVQAGPLYRVVGTELSISCNVSGFRDETALKVFEFRMTKPAQPSREIHIVSTDDKDFGYASHKARVTSEDISLTHVNPNSILFKIKNLLKDDEGEYDCSVKDTERLYDGTYSVKTQVKVIDDSLSVSLSDSHASLKRNEGEALTLTCQASSNTIQHTHLSFGWYLKKAEGDAQPIISLDRYLTLIPGQGFEQRYQEGEISLDKLGETTYRLKMSQLKLSDQGRIYCQAQEWIQDPDRSWYMITQKEADEVTLTVKAREVLDTSSLVVKLTAEQTALQEGDELLLSCSIDTQNLEGRFFTVAWLWNDNELVRIGPTGVLSVRSEYSGRDKEGELRATRTGNRVYQLKLKPVRTADQGSYVCRARLEERGNDGGFTQGVTKDSDPLQVKVSAAESELSVTMQDVPQAVTQRDKLRLVCKVGGATGQLSVTWQLKQKTLFATVISLNQEGVMETAPDFVERKVRAMRPAADSFVLELEEVIPSDSGLYQCTVSELKTSGKTHSQSQTVTVTVKPIDSLVKVSLRSRDVDVTVGSNVELMCKVQGPFMPIDVIWSKQNQDSSLNTIVTLSSNGPISWSGEQLQYQVKVERQTDALMYYLKIIGASHREAGVYQCLVSAFLENVHKKLPPSNTLKVMVRNPESKLALSSSTGISQSINSDVHINCKVASQSSPSSLYAVTWLQQQDGANKTILSSDRYAVVTLGSQVEKSLEERISMRRITGPTFELTIRQARISDRGSYKCEVVEWLQDPRGDWYSLPSKSAVTKLNLTEPANDLKVDMREQHLNATEGAEVRLSCSITSGSPSFFYKVTWFYAPHGFQNMNASLVYLDHTGLLHYPEHQTLSDLQGRLRLSRPDQKRSYLKVLRAHEADSGIYWCQVEQYQLDKDGEWKQKASESSGPITLTVDVTDTKLSIEKTEAEMNVSQSENFTIPCEITQQSSDEAQFQVTWFWQKDAETKRPIFTTYRNSTLQARLWKDSVRFSRPLPHQFTLTVLKAVPENSGLYFCEVEEWLHSLTHGWRRATVVTSGNLNVTVQTEGNAGAVSKPDCSFSTWTVVLGVVIAILVFVIVILGLMIHRNKSSGGNKPAPSLWAEQHPLNVKDEL